MTRSRFAGAAWSLNEVTTTGVGKTYGILNNCTISAGIMSLALSSSGNNYWLPRMGDAPDWVFANGKIGFFESAGWKSTDMTASNTEAVLFSWRVGRLSGADVFLFLNLLRVDATNVKLQLRSGAAFTDGVTGTIRATSSNLLLWNTYYLMDVIIDDSAHIFKVRVGTATVADDFTYDYTALRDANTDDGLVHLNFTGYPSAGTGGTLSLNSCAQWQAETLAEEANTVAEQFESSKLLLTPADAGHDQGFTASSPAQTDANKDQNVDECEDGATASDDNTTYVNNAGTASATLFLQSFKTDYIDLVNPAAVCVHCKARGNVASKNTDFYAMICDGTNHAFGLVVIAPDATTWKWVSHGFVASPTGGLFDDSSLGTLQIGVRHIVGALADIGVLTVVQGEAFGMTPQVAAAGGQPFYLREQDAEIGFLGVGLGGVQ